jgi:hypothetical protein
MASRIVESFHAEISPIIESRNCEQLAAALDKWKVAFASNLKPKVGPFNHWDKDDASVKFSLDKGLGWSALMLERCRQGGLPSFIDAGAASLDFCLVSMELNLTISSKTNQVFVGKRGGVNLDGLGIRRDGSFCIAELKGPKDTGNDPCKATHQALCGALAAIALREWIVATARSCFPNQRRPAIANARLPMDEKSIGLYIVMAERSPNGLSRIVQCFDLKERCELIRAACPIIKEIAYFWVPPAFDTTFGTLSVSETY